MPVVAAETHRTFCPSSSVLSSTLSEMASVRAELLTYFTHVLLGDALAAEYLILHLISNVYVSVGSVMLKQPPCFCFVATC